MSKKGLIVILMFVLLAVPVTADAKTYTTEDEVYRLIKKNLLAHTDQFTVDMNIEVMNEIGRNTDLLARAAEIDSKSTSKDADYLGFSVSEWIANWPY